MKWQWSANLAPEDLAASTKLSPSADSAFPSSIPTASIESSESDTSDFDFAGSLRGDSLNTDLAPTTSPAAQARSSLAEAIVHGSAPPVTTTGSPTMQTRVTTPAPTAPTPSPGSATALSAAVAQSLGDGIRPMTVSSSRTGSPQPGGHKPGSIVPDIGSGGYNGPPILTSGTFNITQVVNQPGKYTPNPNNPIPIGAVVGLTATSPGPAITSYTWSGGNLAGYFSTPATQPPPVSQAAPTAPINGTDTYGFIVGPQDNQSYQVTVNVDYQGGGSGTAELDFTSEAPAGSLSVLQLGTQTWKVYPDGTVSAQLNPPIMVGFFAVTYQDTAGTFMITQIVDSIYRQYNDDNGVSWYLTNGPAFPAYNGPLYDTSPTTNTAGYPFLYGVQMYVAQHVDANGTIPASGLGFPYMWDYPSQSVPSSYQTVTARDSFSDYLMYKSDIQGSVWIALSEIDWSWSETAVNVGGTWQGYTSTQPNPTGPTTPAGAAAFPTWVNVGSTFVTTPFKQGS